MSDKALQHGRNGQISSSSLLFTMTELDAEQF